MSNNYNKNNNRNNYNRNQKKPVEQKQKDTKEAAQMFFDANERTMTLVDFKLNVYGEEKHGNFKFKYPSVIERVRIGTLRAQMLDGAEEKSLDPITSDLTYIIAFLRVTMISSPEWFDYAEIDDMVGLRGMFTEVQEWVNNFRLTGGKSQRIGSSTDATNEEILGSDETVQSSN